MTEEIIKLLKKEDFSQMLALLCGEEYLAEILEIKRSLKGKSGISLDVDDTLSATNIAWFEIFIEKFGNEEGLSSYELAEKYGLCQNCPQYQKQEVYDMMHELRENNDFQENLPLVGNSNEIYKELNDKHVEILLYITARPHTVEEGTKNWIKKHKFPESGIIFRPQELDHKYSNIWKASVMNVLYPEISGIIDDNHGILEYLGENYRGNIYVFNSSQDFKKESVHSFKTHQEIFNHITKK